MQTNMSFDCNQKCVATKTLQRGTACAESHVFDLDAFEVHTGSSDGSLCHVETYLLHLNESKIYVLHFDSSEPIAFVIKNGGNDTQQ